jgi:hypothetical protein
MREGVLTTLVLLGFLACGARASVPDEGGVLGAAVQASDQASGLLAAGRTGADVQNLQRQVADAIADLADRLAPQGGSPTSMQGEAEKAALTRQGTVTAEPDVPGEESVLPAGEWAVGRLAAPGDAAAWQPRLPAAELKELSDAFAEGRLPAHYRERLRAYGRALAGSDDGRGLP